MKTSNSKQNDWVFLIINRFEEQLPCRSGTQTNHSKINAEHIQTWLIKISKYRFSLIFPGFIKILTRLNESSATIRGSEAEKNHQESLLIVLETLEKCLKNQPKDTTRLDEAMNVKLLLREICQFIVSDGSSNEYQTNANLKAAASKVLHTVSDNFFNVIFSRISGRLEELSSSTEENPDCGDVELIQHIAIDVYRLIKIFNEVIQKFKLLKKSSHACLIHSLEIGIWHWMDAHPEQFAEIHKVTNNELSKSCESLFEILDCWTDWKKGRCNVWSLQLLLLILCPKVLEEIANADTGAPCSPKHSRKKQFVDTLKRSVNAHGASNKHSAETSAVALVKLCKAATYINIHHSNNVLFVLVTSVFNDLKAVMFNPNKPFYRSSSCGLQDAEIITECFVAYFRLKPHNMEPLKVCLGPTAVPLYQYVLASALYRIITEVRLAWWPQIDIFYNKSSELRTMFTDTLNKVTHGFAAHTPLRMIQSLTLKGKDGGCKFRSEKGGGGGGSEEMATPRTLLSMLVKVVHADPMLMLSNQGKTGHEIQSSTLELINGLVSLVHQTACMPDVAQEAMEALLVLHQPDKIEMWNPEAPINTFWDVSSQVLFSISQKMIQHQICNYTDILKWLKQILTRRNEFLTRHKEYANVGTHIPICKHAHIKLEVVFLIYLWSTELEAVLTAMSCFSLLCEEAEIRCSVDDIPVVSLLPNYPVYLELAMAANLTATTSATVPATATMTTTGGNVSSRGIQKRIAGLLRKLDHCVNGVQPAWEETFRNWELSTKVISNFSKGKGEDCPQMEACHKLGKRRPSQQNHEQDVEDHIHEWANMTGFLCSLGGVLLRHKTSHSRQIFSEFDFKAFGANPGTTAQDVQYCPVTQFLSQLLRLLLVAPVEKDKHVGCSIRAHIKDLAGNEMHPALYPILFEQIKGIVEKFFDQHGQAVVEAGNTQFVEEFVEVAKAILSREKGGVEGDGSGGVFGGVNIEGTVLTIVRYARHLDVSVATMRMKTKICQLAEAIVKKRDDLSFRHEMKFRNKMVEYLTDWVVGGAHQQQSAGTSFSPASSGEKDKSDRMDLSPITRDLDQACLEAVACLLNGLPLQPEESDRGDLNEAKSQLFLKYFTLFMNLLNDYADAGRMLEREENASGIPDRKVNVGAESAKLNALRNAIIQAVTNLLSANIDSGLMHSIVATHHVSDPFTKKELMDSALSSHIDITYSKDTQNRAAFMEVLTKILQQGAEFNMLADSVLADRYEQLVQLVTMINDKGELPIAMALANVVTTTQMDELARVFVTIFEAKHSLSPLLWNMFYREVEVSDCMQTLFRGNSLGSKIMAFCFKMYGAEYLQKLLAPFVQPLLEDKRSFEVDKTRLNPGEDLKENRANLISLTQTVFAAIISSGPAFPSQLRSMCHCLYQVLSKRFPQLPSNNVSSVGTVIFLRFINPAIVSPQEYGIVNSVVPPHIKRCLMLMSKILQNIANHVEFSKEQHMLPFNDFLKMNFESARRFFIYIASDMETEEPPAVLTPHTTMSFISDANVQTLHRLLHNHQERIGEYLSNRGRDQKAIGRRPFDKLATLLAYLGPPESSKSGDSQWNVLDMPRVSTCNNNGSAPSRNPWISPEDYKAVKSANIFYQYGTSKAGNPVFYYIARRYKHAEMNSEKLMMFVIQTLTPFQHAPYELLIDFTHTGTDNRFRTTCLKNWMCCRGLNRDNLAVVYVYNCNTWVREYTKFHDGILGRFKGSRNVVFLDNVAKLGEFVAPDWQKLPGTTLALEEDVKVFNGALKLSHKDAKVAIKVGSSTLQITHMEKSKVLSHYAILNDVYYASEIEEVALVDDNQFTVTITNEAAPLSFIHNDCEAIVQCIVHIRSRWELSQPESVVIHHKIRPKDVPGTLLNMALLNLGSSDPNLRTAAYNQLCALTAKFDLKIEGRLLETAGLCIPSNNTIFIKSVSETLATNEMRLTLEFLDECIQSFEIANIEMKHLCLEYMTPWLPNLVKFCTKSSDEGKKQKVVQILEKLIALTIQEVEMYPSIQAKIWGSIGKVTDLIDAVLESFLKRSAEAGIDSPIVEILADTTVALASANVKFVARKIISRMCKVFEKTCVAPTASLEEHALWGDITILSRYLLMLSFNNCLHVTEHLPYLFHVVTFLVHSGPTNMRASIHGLVINIIHSLCTCSHPTFSAETQKVLQMSLDEFSLRKYYPLFGISQVKSATVAAFRYHLRTPPAEKQQMDQEETGGKSTTKMSDKFAAVMEKESISLSSLEVITDALLEIMEACEEDVENCKWLAAWTEMAKKFAFRYNPALQPRALIVFGCICKSITDRDILELLRILVKALKESWELSLIEAPICCLTRVQPLLRADSRIHGFLFWIGVSVLQLENECLFETGLALMEQNLHTLDSLGVFDNIPLDEFMMSSREPVEKWYFRTMDGEVGLSFKDNFHFALAGHLIKGFRHGASGTKSRTARVLTSLLAIVAKPHKRDKFKVTTENIAYLAALVAVSEEVRNRCRLKYVETVAAVAGLRNSRGIAAAAGMKDGKSLESSSKSEMKAHSDDSTESNAFPNKGKANREEEEGVLGKTWKSLDLEPCRGGAEGGNANSNKLAHRSSSCSDQTHSNKKSTAKPKVAGTDEGSNNESSSTSSENGGGNVLLDADVITDTTIQVLTLTILSTLVKYSTDEFEMRVLYQYLAEGSVVFSKVFRVIYTLLDARLTSILQNCHDEALLNSVQSIIHNMIACEDTSQDHLYYVHTCGFGGLWRFAGPFNKSNSMVGTEMFANYLEAVVETILPEGGEEQDGGASTQHFVTTQQLVAPTIHSNANSPVEKENSSYLGI